MNILKLLTKEINDVWVRENFKRLNDYFRNDRNLLGFEHFIITVTQTGTNQRLPHNLGYQPFDVIVTSMTGPGVVAFNYALFSKTELDFSVTSGTPTKENPTVIRAYIGSHIGGAF